MFICTIEIIELGQKVDAVNFSFVSLADTSRKDLSNMHTLQVGDKGMNGRKKDMHGKNAEHKYVPVNIQTNQGIQNNVL